MNHTTPICTVAAKVFNILFGGGGEARHFLEGRGQLKVIIFDHFVKCLLLGIVHPQPRTKKKKRGNKKELEVANTQGGAVQKYI